MDSWLLRDVLLFALGAWVATMALLRLMARQRERALRQVNAEIEQERRAKTAQGNSQHDK